MVRVLVVGGRHFGRVPGDCPHAKVNARIARASEEQKRLHDVLRELHAASPTKMLLHFDNRGAQRLSAHWASIAGVPVTKLNLSDYKPRQGKDAAVRAMLTAAKIDVVLAFSAPFGEGEAEIPASARGLGIAVRSVSLEDVRAP